MLYCYIVTLVTQKLFSETVNCYLLFVTQKKSFLETVNCQTVTLAIDIGFALMMFGVYEYFTNTQYKEVLMYC